LLYDTSNVLQKFVIKKQKLQKLVFFSKIIYKYLVMKGSDIRKRRKELGWKQSEIAKRMGVSVNTVSTWERGGSIPETTMKRLIDVLYSKEDISDKKALVYSLNNQIHQATNDLINALNEKIEEVKKDTTSIKSFEEIQQMLKLKIELVEQLKKSME